MAYFHPANLTGPRTATVHFTVTRREVQVLTPIGGVPQVHSLKAVLGPDHKAPVDGRFQTVARQVIGGDRAPQVTGTRAAAPLSTGGRS